MTTVGVDALGGLDLNFGGPSHTCAIRGSPPKSTLNPSYPSCPCGVGDLAVGKAPSGLRAVAEQFETGSRSETVVGRTALERFERAWMAGQPRRPLSTPEDAMEALELPSRPSGSPPSLKASFNPVVRSIGLLIPMGAARSAAVMGRPSAHFSVKQPQYLRP